MKKASKILLLPLTLMVLLTGCDNDPETELVDIPESTFLDALIALGVDRDHGHFQLQHSDLPELLSE